MKNFMLVVGAVCAMSLCYLAGTFTTGCSVAAKNWEYKIMRVDMNDQITAVESKLNALGSQGWEVCSEVGGGTGFLMKK